jgi:hypothetical protein
VQRHRAYEVLAVGLSLLLALGWGLSSPAPSPSAAEDPHPAHAELVGQLPQEHVVARPGHCGHPTVGKLVAVVLSSDYGLNARAYTEGDNAVRSRPSAPVPRMRPVRAPPGVSAT